MSNRWAKEGLDLCDKKAHQLADDEKARGPLRDIDQIKFELTEWAAVGPKTAAEFTVKTNPLDPPLRSSMGPFFFGDSR